MSFEAALELAGNTYNVINCRIVLQQRFGRNGKPASDVHAARMQIILEGTDDITFGAWIGEHTKKHNGRIVFYQSDQPGATFKEVKFEGAYLLTLIENFTVETQTTQSLLMQYDEIETDLTAHDSGEQEKVKNALKSLFGNQLATGMSYCVLLKMVAEKIIIDGVEHAV